MSEKIRLPLKSSIEHKGIDSLSWTEDTVFTQADTWPEASRTCVVCLTHRPSSLHALGRVKASCTQSCSTPAVGVERSEDSCPGVHILQHGSLLGAGPSESLGQLAELGGQAVLDV